MRDATESPDSNPSSDPTLVSLVPERSTVRNRVLIWLAVLVLLGVWVSPYVLRPSVVPEDGRGAWFPLPPNDEVITMALLQPRGWTDFTLHSVSDVPGATVVASWVIPGAEWRWDLDPADFTSGLEYVTAAAPSSNTGIENHQLPQRIDPSGRSWLITLWRIVGCSLLAEDLVPEVTLRSVVRTSSHQQLLPISAPGFDLETLTNVGICPSL